MHYINDEQIQRYRLQLVNEEKSDGTIKLYIRSMYMLKEFLGENTPIQKETMLSFKIHLMEKGYKVSTANVKLAAINHYFEINDIREYKVKLFKKQNAPFRENNRELSQVEFHLLLDAARKRGKRRLFSIILTIGMTGIRISELSDIRVEDLDRGYSTITNKGKIRSIVLPDSLCMELKDYCQEREISKGAIFLSKTGNRIDRRNLLREIKALGKEANISDNKLFPHNFRHLFAVRFYEQSHNLSMLSDILGHSDINTTRIYTRQSMEQQKMIIDQLGFFQSFHK